MSYELLLYSIFVCLFLTLKQHENARFWVLTSYSLEWMGMVCSSRIRVRTMVMNLMSLLFPYVLLLLVICTIKDCLKNNIPNIRASLRHNLLCAEFDLIMKGANQHKRDFSAKLPEPVLSRRGSVIRMVPYHWRLLVFHNDQIKPTGVCVYVCLYLSVCVVCACVVFVSMRTHSIKSVDIEMCAVVHRWIAHKAYNIPDPITGKLRNPDHLSCHKGDVFTILSFSEHSEYWFGRDQQCHEGLFKASCGARHTYQITNYSRENKKESKPLV